VYPSSWMSFWFHKILCQRRKKILSNYGWVSKFTSNNMEVWGAGARVDNFLSYFMHKIKIAGLVDMEPIDLSPTWRNNRIGVVGVSKCLNKFLVS